MVRADDWSSQALRVGGHHAVHVLEDLEGDDVELLAEGKLGRLVDDATKGDRGVVAAAGAEGGDLMVVSHALEAGDEDHVAVLQRAQQHVGADSHDVGVPEVAHR